MLEINGKFNSAKIFTDNIEEKALSQILELCNQEFTSNSKIRIMPDVHAGAGCTIGTTMTIQDKIVPNLVGVDIGCGMLVIKLEETEIDFKKLDEVINLNIPSGFGIRTKPLFTSDIANLNELVCHKIVNKGRANLSIGTLGGGNHFIEVNQNEKGEYFLVIHSGSRNIGKQVAEYYQNLGYQELINRKVEKEKIICHLKETNQTHLIESTLNGMKTQSFTKSLAWLEGQNFNDYISDMIIIQKYAHLNRMAIAGEIINKMKLHEVERFTTIHNYIDTESMILRKGAVSAQEGEKLIVPMNMRDGSLICIGRGNGDWNYSAPHGAGRLMSRSKAKENVILEDYIQSMEGIYTTSVSNSTLDESPQVYKPMQEIIDNVQDTIEIKEIIKTVYNFKAG